MSGSASAEAAALSRLMIALSPYRGDVVLIGGWAHRLSRLHPLAQSLDFEPLYTQDADLAIPATVPPRAEDLRALLLKAGFKEHLLGEHEPPVTRYELGDEGLFYAEFLTPLVGLPKVSTTAIAGVTAQALRYLDILIVDPWSVLLKEPEFPVGQKAVEVRIANPASYLAQKILILGKRSAADRAKDVLYLHDTLITFGRSLAELERIWTDRVSPLLLPAARRTLEGAAEHLFAEVTDPVREASRIAREAGRPLRPQEIASVCRTGLAKVFGGE
jgi:hypothetical protein